MYIEEIDHGWKWNELKENKHIKSSYQWKDTYFKIYNKNKDKMMTVEEAMKMIENELSL